MPGIEIKGRSKIANYRHGGRTRKFGGGRTNLLEELGRVEAEPSNRNRRAEISRVHGELNRGYAKGGRAGFAGGASAIKGALKKVRDRITHEVPTGPHTDVRRRKINPSFLNPDVESGRTKEWKRKHGGFKNIAKDVVKGVLNKKDGGTAGKYQETYRQPQLKKSDLQEFSRKRKEERADKFKNPKRKFPPEKPTWSDMPRRPLEKSKMQPLKKGGKADKNWIQKAVNPKHKGYCTPMTKKTCTPARKALARTFKKKAKTGW